jgi:pectate lyase
MRGTKRAKGPRVGLRTVELFRPALVALPLIVAACSSDGTGDDTSTGGSAGSSGAGVAGAAAGAGVGGSAAGGASTGGTSGASGNATGGAGSGAAGAGASGTGGAATTGGTAGLGTGGVGAAPGTGGTADAGSAGAGMGGSAGLDSGGAGPGGAGAGGASAGMAGSSGAGGAGASGAAGTGGSGPDPGNGELIGFATLNGGTTGGADGETVTATTYDQLKTYAESATAYVIMVQGTITNGAAGGQIRVKSNKSLIGVGSTAFLSGVGIDIANSNNVIIQNLRISLVGISGSEVNVNDGDAIGISGTSKNIWIDHCEIFSEDPSQQTNIDKYDGLIDIKGQTGFITISWNYLHDHHKGGLVGSADDDLFADRKITFHHNHYDNVKLRIPMYRGSVGHFFNNYIAGANDATEIRASTCVRVEKNYYESLHYSIYTTSDSPGNTERIDNVEVSRTDRAYPGNCTADIPYDYASALTDTTNDVKTLVPAGAGVGKL